MQIVQLSMLLWAFFENSYAGEDLWHSFLTQHLNFPFFPSGISHSWVFDSLGVGSISNERVQFKPRAEGHFEVHFDNAFSVPPKTLSIFSCLHCLSEFRSATSVIFFFLGGADRFCRTCLTRNKHLPGWKFPKRHAWPWSFSVTLNLTNHSAENTHNTFAVFRHRDPLWFVQSEGGFRALLHCRR